jgi:MYXO-CTERM domain-containing protein
MPRRLITLLVMSVLVEVGSGRLVTAATVDDLQARTFTDAAGRVLPYRLYVPAGYDPAKKYPLVLFLHGAGGRGTDNRLQITDQPASLVFITPENQARWPVFLVAPQCPPAEQWVAMPWGTPSGKGKRPAEPTWPLAAAMAVVDQLTAEFLGIDPTNLYVTGFSMGGYGTFDAAARHPKKWRAAVPICGGYDETQIAPLVRLPLWAFHAEDDHAVPVARTRDVIAALRAAGGHPKYTEYPASARHGHFSWLPAYADPELLPWLFGPHPAEVETPQAGVASAAKPTAAPPQPSPARHRGCACAAAAPDPRGGLWSIFAPTLLALGIVMRRRRS